MNNQPEYLAFEKDLLNKLDQRTRMSETPENCLLKAFKFVDVMNKGVVNKQQFVKAVQKVGSVQINDQVDSIFAHYDTSKSGNINYSEFITQLFGNASVYKKQIKSNEIINIEEISLIIKKKLAPKGMKYLFHLAKSFKYFDSGKTQTICSEDFIKSFRDLKIGFDDLEIKKTFAAFDHDKRGNINYINFLRSLKGHLKPEREALVKMNFEKIDINHLKILKLEDLIAFYNPQNNPSVLDGKKTEALASSEFQESILAYNDVFRDRKDTIFNYEDFKDFYSFISFTVESDEYFADLINSSWTPKFKYHECIKTSPPKLFEIESKNKSSIESRDSPIKLAGKIEDIKQYPEENISKLPKVSLMGSLPKSQNIMVERIRSQFISKGPKSLLELYRQMKVSEATPEGTISKEDFVKSIQEIGIKCDTKDLESIALVLEKKTNGKINIPEVISLFIGPITENRKNLINKSFTNLTDSNQNFVEITNIKKFYNPSSHPDIKLGKKNEKEVLNEFLETFDLNHSIINNFNSSTQVSRNEFEDYYTIISATIPNDSIFDQMLTNCWNLKLTSLASKLPFAGASAKVYNINSQNQCKLDHHRSLYEPGYLIAHQSNMPEISEEDMKSEGINRGSNIAAGLPSFNKFGKKNIYEEDNFKNMSDAQMLKFMRDKLLQKGLRHFFSFIYYLNKISSGENSKIDLMQFQKILYDFKLPFNSTEIFRLFNMFDNSNSGLINYYEFISVMCGEMNAYRKQLISKIFSCMKLNDKNMADLSEIRSKFIPGKHPEVKTGKRLDSDVRNEFMETMEMFLEFKKTEKNSISPDNFFNYYDIISSSIEDDQHFDLIVRSIWGPCFKTN